MAGVSLMGGGSFGNRSTVAEFNIWADPEAAAIVFASGVPLVMAGLDVTHQFLVTDARIAEVDAIGGRLASVLADLFRFFAGTYTRRHDHMVGAALHDPLAVLALTHPALFTSSERHVAVETHGELTRGMTVIDRRDLKERPRAELHRARVRRLRRRVATDRRGVRIAAGRAAWAVAPSLPSATASAPVRPHPALHARRAARPRRQPRRRAGRVRPQPRRIGSGQLPLGRRSRERRRAARRRSRRAARRRATGDAAR